MPKEVILPEIDRSKKPLSASFDPSMFAAAKGTAIPPASTVTDNTVTKDEKTAEPAPKEEIQKDINSDGDILEREELGANPADIDLPLAKRFTDDKDEKEDNKEELEDKEEVTEEPEIKPLVDKRKESAAPKEDKEVEVDNGKGETITVLPGVDIEAFGEEEYEKAKPFLKNMSRQSREYFSAQLKASRAAVEEAKKAGTNGLPTAYYEHPEAYILAPEYKQNNATLQIVSSELEHWKEQKALVKAGKAWENLGRDENGNYIKIPVPAAEDAKAESLAEDYLLDKIQQGNGLVARSQANIEALQKNFSGIMQQRLGTLKQIEDTLFPDYKDEKKLSTNKHYTKMSNVLKSKGMTAVPASVFNKLYTYAMEREAYISELEAGNKGIDDTKTKEVRAKLGPSSGDLDGGGGTTKSRRAAVSDAFDPEEYNRIKRGAIG